MVLFAVEASAGSSVRPCGVYMFSGLTTQVFYIIMLHRPIMKGLILLFVNDVQTLLGL